MYKIERGVYSLYLKCGNIKFPLHHCALINESNKKYLHNFTDYINNKKITSSKWIFEKKLFKIKSSYQSVVYKIKFIDENNEPLEFIFTIYDEHTPFKELEDFTNWVNNIN